MLGALQTVLKGVMDPAAIETFAAVRALEFAKDMGFTNIPFEGMLWELSIRKKEMQKIYLQ